MGRELSRDGSLQGTWPLSPSKEGIGARSQQDPQDLWASHGEPEGSLQPCHQPAPAPGGVSHPQLVGQQAKPGCLLPRLSPGMRLAKGSWQSPHRWDGVFGAAHTQQRCSQPQLGGMARTKPLGEGILQHLGPRPAFPASPPLLQTKQRYWVQSRRACIASSCGASGETSSRREKRTEGLKTIPISRVTLCHANSPGTNPKPHPSRARGECARWPSRAPAAHPLLPIARAGPGASPGAGVPQPCSPASMAHAGWRLRPSRNSPCSLPPLQKIQAAWGACPPPS